MHNLCLHILTPRSLKSVNKCQRYNHFIARGYGFKNNKKAKAHHTANTVLQCPLHIIQKAKPDSYPVVWAPLAVLKPIHK